MGYVGQRKKILTVPRHNFFYGSLVLIVSFVCHTFASVHCCLVVTCWERADSWLLFVMFNCVFVTFQCRILGQVWHLIVSIPDFCLLSYFNPFQINGVYHKATYNKVRIVHCIYARVTDYNLKKKKIIFLSLKFDFV